MGVSRGINSQLNVVVGSIALKARVHESMGRDIKPAWRVKEGTMSKGKVMMNLYQNLPASLRSY